MRRFSLYGFNVFVVALSILSLSGIAYPCSVVRSNVQLSLFSCDCAQTPTSIQVASGTMVLTNRNATPKLGSIVIELSAKKNGKYVVVARHVFDEAGHSIVNTCAGSFADGPINGHIVFTDANGNEITFADVKNLPEGSVSISYLATFAGNIPEIIPGQRIKVKTMVTVIGAHANAVCSVDADGDGTVDSNVRTITFQKTVKVPGQATDLTP